MRFARLKKGLNAGGTGRFTALLLALLFLIGMIYGVLCFYFSSDTSSAFGGAAVSMAQGYAQRIHTDSMLICLKNAFSSTLLFLALAYLLGYSAIAQPIILLLLPVRGLGVGFFMASLYREFGLRGVLYCLLVLLVNLVVSFFCILIACREAFALSNMLFKSFAVPHSPPVTAAAVKLYNLKIGILLAIGFAGALSELLFSVLFGGVLK